MLASRTISGLFVFLIFKEDAAFQFEKSEWFEGD